MRIQVANAAGTAPTELAAFDAALVAAGVADRNLIYLSSVLPPGSEVVRVARVDTPGGWGDRLYCVVAQARTSVPGTEAWAGIGWAQDTTTGRGLLVEHDAPCEAEVRRLIDTSLDALCRNRDIALPHRGTTVVGAVCDRPGEAVCALAVAVFEATGWQARQHPRPRRRWPAATLRRIVHVRGHSDPVAPV